jgi:hypothetical protein
MMNTFTIDDETNNITFHTEPFEDASFARFATQEEFVFLSGDWPKSRLIDIWNSLPGVTPVTKFKDRKAATTRIWNAIQVLAEPLNEAPQEATQEPESTIETEAISDSLDEPAADLLAYEREPNVGTQAPDVAPETAATTTKATRQKKAPTGEPKAPRGDSKTSQAIARMKAPGGTTLKMLMETFSWQAHSVRGFISGTLTKKMGLTVVSTKGENGERTYTIGS